MNVQEKKPHFITYIIHKANRIKDAVEMVREQIRISALFQISRMDMPPLVLWLFLSSAQSTQRFIIIMLDRYPRTI